MRKVVSMSIVVLLILTMFAGNSFANSADQASQANGNQDVIEGELIVSVEPKNGKPDVSIQSAQSVTGQEDVLKSKGFTIVDTLHVEDSSVKPLVSKNFNKKVVEKMGLVYLVQYSPDQFKSSNIAKKELRKELMDLGFKVRYISENYKMMAIEGTATLQAVHPNQNWHYNMIKAPEAWAITSGSSSVKVAVLDTGIDHNHPSLANFVNTNLGRSFVGGNTMDVQGHGTHVAGTIASYGSVSGVMQSATLIPVKVLDNSGSGSLYGITQGILYAADIDADVINMSLGGGGYNQSMDEAVQTAVAQGTIVVAATGNDGASSISYPAAYSSVIAVGSVTSNRTRSSFSNYGSGLEVMAPGSNIYSTYPNSRYTSLSGTSMATPHVAGVAGLIRAANPDISVAQARQILRDTAQEAGSFTQYGYGIVDAHAAVVAASGGSGGGTTPPPPSSTDTVTTVSTNYSYYYRGETVYMTSTVKDSNGVAISNATVNFKITRPNGTSVTATAATNSSGVATYSIGTNYSTATGTYRVDATASKSGYTTSSASTTFRVR
ncbi:S8 family serine peptidase [Bacillus sinesaloumensis]|uniref:S8 family serine peptidase n=1 Tax=Litchfieldia sinesaloumensis TaxID=1926280 RepID=UPI0009883BD8|nr:S8 family serine peptidase [Bacillus sinesaloumensis]